ncbi:hypothetical protein TrVGV298_001398 [Trichoderma virens]|nr:hypothetical protein TrVGV298_001398 [Trichoderma virens]
MANLASLYHAQGRYSEAEAMEVQVLDLRQELLGKKHPDTLFAIHNLAHTWKMQGRHHDALALMEECVQSRRSVLGPEHPLTVKSIEYLERWKSEDETLRPNRVDEKSEPSRDDLDQAATTPSRLNTEDEPESFAQPDDVTIRFKGTNAKLSNTELSSWANASDGSDLAEDLDDPPELRLYTPTSKSLPFHRVLARPQQAASSLPTQAILEKADEVDPGVEEDFGPRLKRVGHIEFDKIAEANTEINKRHTVPPPAPPYTPLETTTAVVDDDGANDKTMADTVKRSDGMGSDPIKFPQRRPTVEDILRMERERNKPNEILRIPGPRETERGSGPRRIEGDDEQEDEDRLIARQTTVESGDDEPNDKMKAYERKPIIYEEDLRYREKEKHDEEEAQRQRLLERFMPRRRNTAGEDSRRRPVIVDDSTPGGTYNDSHITAEESTVDQLEVSSNSEEPTRKQMQSRKGLERRFECNAEGCGKSYSRAEHLYRHQLNHNSKQIFRCEYPNCVRTFVRGDLLKRHMDRHTAKGSQLDRRDSMVSHAASVASPKLAPADSSRPVPVPVPIEARSSRMDRAPYEPHKPNEPITYEHAPYDPSLAASKLY